MYFLKTKKWYKAFWHVVLLLILCSGLSDEWNTNCLVEGDTRLVLASIMTAGHLDHFTIHIYTQRTHRGMKYYNLSKRSFGGMGDPYTLFGGMNVVFWAFVHESQGNVGGMHSWEAHVTKKHRRNDHFFLCLHEMHSTCVLWDICETWKFDV